MARDYNLVQEAWVERKLAGMLLIDVNRAFDHVSSNYVLRIMECIGTDRDLMRWTE